MRDFGKTLFSGTRFIRWTVIPCAILSGVFMLFPPDGWSWSWAWKAGLIESALLLLVLSVGWPRRFRWAGRILAAEVFAVCVALLVGDFHKHAGGASWSEKEVWNATRMMLVGGLPSLWYAVRGRLGFGETEVPQPTPKLGERLPELPEKDPPHEPH